MVTIRTPPGEHTPLTREEREVALQHAVNTTPRRTLAKWVADQRLAGELRYHYDIQVKD
jgi:hypothetical protein